MPAPGGIHLSHFPAGPRLIHLLEVRWVPAVAGTPSQRRPYGTGNQ
jgi:hypothetical protein